RPADEPVDTDIGSVRLPRGEGRGLKVLEGHFISESAMSRLLAGQLEGISHAHEEGDTRKTIWPAFPPEGKLEIPALADLEFHVGLGRDNATRRHVDGMLYGISLIRLRPGVRFAVRVEGVDERIHPQDETIIVPLGGEGKLARLVVDDARPWPKRPELKTGADGKLRFRIVLTTPACMPEKGWLPEGFVEGRGIDGGLRWQGCLQGVECSIVSACIGKAVPMGGWNMAEGRPRPLQPHVPAGSVYFCEADASQIKGIQNLHGSHMGQNTALGFGHILIGCW
ncbi:MAG: type III-B CRISPR module-associated protein Cmr3, partial [Calditrichaeota bacterium]